MAESKKPIGAGKGDAPRPMNKKVYDQNYDDIDWSEKPKIRGRRKHGIILDDWVNWDDGGSVIDPGGVVYDGASAAYYNRSGELNMDGLRKEQSE